MKIGFVGTGTMGLPMPGSSGGGRGRRRGLASLPYGLGARPRTQGDFSSVYQFIKPSPDAAPV